MEIITGTFHDIKISVNGLALQVLFNAIEILPEKAKDFRIFCYLVLQIWDFCRYLQIYLNVLYFQHVGLLEVCITYLIGGVDVSC